MIIDLKYKRNVNFLGRNGMFKQAGMAITRTPGQTFVTLQPFTSMGNIGTGFLEIPIEDVPAVIDALQKLVPASSPVDTLIETYEKRHPEVIEIKRAIGEFHRAVADASGDAPGKHFGPE